MKREEKGAEKYEGISSGRSRNGCSRERND